MSVSLLAAGSAKRGQSLLREDALRYVQQDIRRAKGGRPEECRHDRMAVLEGAWRIVSFNVGRRPTAMN